MKHLALIAVLMLSASAAGGRENIHYRWLEGYADQHIGYRSSKGSIYLQKDYHPNRIRYFEGYGGESFEIFWKRPGCDSADALPMEEILYLD